MVAVASIVTHGAACSVAFDFDRRSDLPDTGEARGRVVREATSAPAPFAKVSAVGRGTFSRADVDGRFRVAGLPAGTHVLAFHEDTNGDGFFERAGQRGVRLIESRPAFETTTVLSGITLGDVSIRGLATLTGEVRDAVGGVAAAKVIVRRVVVSTDETNIPTESTLGIESHVVTDARGRFVMPNVIEGTVVVTALLGDQGTTVVASEHTTVDALPGSTVSNLVLSVTRPLPPDVDVDIIMTPANVIVDDAVVLVVVAGMPPTNPAALLTSTTVGTNRDGNRARVTLPAGVAFDVYVDVDGGVPINGALFRQVAFTNNDAAPVVVGPVLLGPWDPCVAIQPSDAVRDCDNDGRPGLPLVVDDDGNITGDLAIWRACTDACRGAFGTAAGLVTCRVDEQVYDCDDDGDDQPDVTEPPECYGVSRGGDRDGDGICDVVDPAPYCVGSTVLEEPCAFSPPPPWVLFDDDVDGGIADGGIDAGSDGGVDGGGESDAGVGDAGIGDAGIVDGGVDGGTGINIDLFDVVVAAGGLHSCAVDASGAMWCFGSNARGQINPMLHPSIYDVTVPARAPLAPGDVVRVVATGSEHTCAIIDDPSQVRRVSCWGANDDGQLGTFSFATVHDVDVASAGAPNPVALSSRHQHACVLDATGVVVCWGANFSGECGQTASTFPVPPVVVNFPVAIVSIAAGKHATCGVGIDGQVYCLGDDADGQLGRDVPGTATHIPAPVVMGGSPLVGQQDVTAGSYHACARALDGTTTCWGRGDDGATGVLTPGAPVLPTTMSGLSFTSVVAGAEHTCGIDAGGIVSCWGDNALGQAGPGAPAEPSSTPTVVTSNVRSLAAGYLHSCTVSPSDNVRCFGSNAHGELGNGTTTASPGTEIVATALPAALTWTGAFSTDMNDPANWHPPTAPGPAHSIRFSGNTDAVSTNAMTVGHVVIEPTANGTITLDAPITIGGSFVHASAVLSLDADDVVVGTTGQATVVDLRGLGAIETLTVAGQAALSATGATTVATTNTTNDVVTSNNVWLTGAFNVGPLSTFNIVGWSLFANTMTVAGEVNSSSTFVVDDLLVTDTGQFNIFEYVSLTEADVAFGGEIRMYAGSLWVTDEFSVGGAFVGGSSPVQIGSLNVRDDGEFIAPSGILTVTKGFSVTDLGLFEDNSGSVHIFPSVIPFNVNVTNVTFWRLSIFGPGYEIDFADGANLTVNENLVAAGASGTPLTLRSDTSATLNALGGRDVRFVHVENITAPSPMGGFETTVSGGETGWGSVCGNYVVEAGERCDTQEVGNCDNCQVYDVPEKAFWTGAGGDGAFGNAANWMPVVVPPPASILVFDQAGSGDCNFTGFRAAVRMEGAYDGVVRVVADATVSGPWVLEAGTLAVTNGTLTLNSGLAHSPDATLQVDFGATLRLRAASTLNSNTNGSLDRVFADFQLGDSTETIRLVGTQITTLEIFVETENGIILDPVYGNDESDRIANVLLRPDQFLTAVPYSGRFSTSILPVAGDVNVIDSGSGSINLESSLQFSVGGSFSLRRADMFGRAIMRGTGTLLVDDSSARLYGNTAVEAGHITFAGQLGQSAASGALIVSNGGTLAAAPGTTSAIAYSTVRIDDGSALTLRDATVDATVVTIDGGGWLLGGRGALTSSILSVASGGIQIPTTTDVGVLSFGTPDRVVVQHNCSVVNLNSDGGPPNVRAGGHTLFGLALSQPATSATFAATSPTLPLTILNTFDFDFGSGGSLSGVNGRPTLVIGGAPNVTGVDNWNAIDHVGKGYITREAISTLDGTNVVAPPSCGDGLVTDDEGCDPNAPDGAVACAPTCNVRFGFVCNGNDAVQTCGPVGGECGNGFTDPAEGCDDGNFDDGDGCSATCTVESAFVCGGCPSDCTPVP